MKSTAKFSKLNVFICCLLVVLLIGSLCLTVTGAWFTDSDLYSSDSNTIQFGRVSLTDTIYFDETQSTYNSSTSTVGKAITYLVPSQNIYYYGKNETNIDSDIHYTGNVAAYYKISFSITDIKTASNQDVTSEVATSLRSMFTLNGGDTATTKYGTVAAGGRIPKGYIVFSSTADSSLANLHFNLNMTINVVQQANINIPNVNTSRMNLDDYTTLFNALF